MAKLEYQVHRFGDNVALSFADSSTVYLTHAQAEELAEVLTDAAADVIARPFVKSLFETRRAQIETHTKNGKPAARGFSLDRDAAGFALIDNAEGVDHG